MPYLVVVSIIWGFSFVIIKGTLVPLDPGFVSFSRLLLSLAAFVPFARTGGIDFKEKLQLLGIGSIQFGLMYIAYVAAYRDLPAHVIALLTTTTPLFVTCFHDLFEKSFHKIFFVAALLAVAGGIVLELPKQAVTTNLRGVALVQLSNAAFGFGQTAYARWKKARPALRDRQIFALLYLGAALTAGFFSLLTTDYAGIRLDTRQALALLYLGIIASGICFFLWNTGASKVGGGTLAVMNNLKIPVGLIASLVILKETTNYWRLIPGCLLLGLALWVNSRANRSRPN